MLVTTRSAGWARSIACLSLVAASFSLLSSAQAQTKAGAMPAAAASATEATANDPVSRLLAEKGLLPSGAAASAVAGASVAPVEPSQPPQDDAVPDPDAKPEPKSLRSKMADVASDMVISAMNFLGVPYKRGGQSATGGFDCSGFTRFVFENSLGLVLPRRAEEQARAPGLINIPKDQLKPGDLVFFNTLRRTFSHVGIYIGDNKFIHSPRAGGEVRIEDMRIAYWTQRFNGARRAPATTNAARDASGTNTRSSGTNALTPQAAAALLGADPESPGR